MTTRLIALKRIETMCGAVEEMHSVALRQIASRVHEVHTAIAMQYEQIESITKESHRALVDGDRQEWVMASAQGELSKTRCQQLESIRQQREVDMERAREEYAISKIKNEQMKSVVNKYQIKERLVADRKIQAATDDRFLSRMRWNKLQLMQIMKSF